MQSKSQAEFFVCIECGIHQHRLVNKLQEGNYSLERCSRCGDFVDRYVEFDDNLLALQVLLCKPQIYRHLFFNKEKINNIKRLSLIFTAIYLTMLFWFENKTKNGDVISHYVTTQFVPSLSAKEQKMLTLQS
jgi:hypothetical protein